MGEIVPIRRQQVRHDHWGRVEPCGPKGWTRRERIALYCYLGVAAFCVLWFGGWLLRAALTTVLS